jgi:hypothetical protein
MCNSLRVLAALTLFVPVVVPGGLAAEPIEVIPLAEIAPTQIIQSVVGRQDTRQRLTGETIVLAKSARQMASNAGNVIDVSKAPISSVEQTFDGQQRAINEITLNRVFALESIEQEASNTGNAVVGGAIGGVEQNFIDGALQEAGNRLLLPELSGMISQKGFNTINMIYSTQSVEISSQNFAERAEQVVNNQLTVTGAGGNGAITQEGTNLGNIIVAGTVGDVVRDFSGDQLVSNVVTLAAGAEWGSITQNGTNIANYIEAESIGSFSQTSTGTQIVDNRVEVVTLEGLTEQVVSPDIVQNSSNFVNMMVLKKTLADGTSNVVEVSQTADYGQGVTGANAGTVSQTGNSVTIDQ